MTEQPEFPLHQAALVGDIDALNRLIEEGADVDSRDADGRTPLFCAARQGQTVAARHLLKRGARVDSETPKGATALMTSARGGHLEMIRLLLANGADPNQIVHPATLPGTPEEQARRRVFDAQAAIREAKGGTTPAPPIDTGPVRAHTLAIAIMSRDRETVETLLDAGADLEYAFGPARLTPLKSAICFGGLEFVRVIVNRGARINNGEAGET